jgi:dTMP kinase
MTGTQSGFFITLEGVEGSGKTTQVEWLAERLRQAGRAVVTTREPGGTPISDRIRAVVLDRQNVEIHPHTEALLMCAARAQLVHEVIRPALAAGQVVICDRYSDSTYAYQGYARGQDLATLRKLNDFATGGLVPDLTLLLDLPAETGLQRRFGEDSVGTATNRMDQLNLAFHQRVADGYHALAQADPERWRVVDAQGPVDDIAAAVWKISATFLDSS